MKLPRSGQLVRILHLSAKWASFRNFSAVAEVIETLSTLRGTPRRHM
jgi:hypothetical protein